MSAVQTAIEPQRAAPLEQWVVDTVILVVNDGTPVDGDVDRRSAFHNPVLVHGANRLCGVVTSDKEILIGLRRRIRRGCKCAKCE